MQTDKEVLHMKRKKMNAAQRALYDTAHARKGGRRLAGAGRAGTMVPRSRYARRQKARQKKEIKEYLGR